MRLPLKAFAVLAVPMTIAAVLTAVSAHADGVSISVVGSTPIKAAYPNTPIVTLAVNGGSPGNQVALLNSAPFEDGSPLADVGAIDSNLQITLRAVDRTQGFLPVGSYTFTARYGDNVNSDPIAVTVDRGNVNIGFTSVTDNNDGTGNFVGTFSGAGPQTAATAPSGIVSLQKNGIDVAADSFNAGTVVFNNVAFDPAPAAYTLHFWESDNYKDAVSTPYSKGDVITTTTTSTTTSTTVPPTTTTTTVPDTTTTTTPGTPTTTTTTPVTVPSSGTTTTSTAAPAPTSAACTPRSETGNCYDAGQYCSIAARGTNGIAADGQAITCIYNNDWRWEPGTSAPQGYRLVDSDGSVRNYGIETYGDASRLSLNSPIIGAVHTPDDKGYWLLGADGGIFTFGDAQFFGSMGGQHLNKPIVGLAPTSTGNGYWLVASDGGVFAFGDAGFFGSMGGKPLNKPIVGLTAAANGQGYRMVASDGGIFSFGTATFYGSMGGQTLNKPVVGMTSTPDGKGYWLVACDGGIFAYGDAQFYGSTGSMTLNKPIVAMRSTPSGNGYWFTASDGGVFSYGDAQFAGSAGSTGKQSSTVAMS